MPMYNEKRTELYYYKKDLNSLKISFISILSLISVVSIILVMIIFFTCNLKAKTSFCKKTEHYQSTVSGFKLVNNQSSNNFATGIAYETNPQITIHHENIISSDNSESESLSTTTKEEKNINDFLGKYEESIALQVIEIEAEGEGYDGKLAVANVLVNRLNDSDDFPNCMKEIIFQDKQFDSVKNIHFGSKKISSDSKRALLDAFLGSDNVKDSTYFANLDNLPKSSWFFTSNKLDRVTKIGNHTFFRLKK